MPSRAVAFVAEVIVRARQALPARTNNRLLVLLCLYILFRIIRIGSIFDHHSNYMYLTAACCVLSESER